MHAGDRPGLGGGGSGSSLPSGTNEHLDPGRKLTPSFYKTDFSRRKEKKKSQKLVSNLVQLMYFLFTS